MRLSVSRYNQHTGGSSVYTGPTPPPFPTRPCEPEASRKLIPQKSLPCGYQSLSPPFTPHHHHQALPFRTCSLSQWSEQSPPRPPHPFCWRGLPQSTARTTTTPFPSQAPRPLMAPLGTPGLPEGLLPLPQSAH